MQGDESFDRTPGDHDEAEMRGFFFAIEQAGVRRQGH